MECPHGEEAPRWAHIVTRTELQQKALFTLVGLGNYYRTGSAVCPVFEQGIYSRNSPYRGSCVYWGPLVLYTDYIPQPPSCHSWFALQRYKPFHLARVLAYVNTQHGLLHADYAVLVYNHYTQRFVGLGRPSKKELFDTVNIRVVISVFYLPAYNNTC